MNDRFYVRPVERYVDTLGEPNFAIVERHSEVVWAECFSPDIATQIVAALNLVDA